MGAALQQAQGRTLAVKTVQTWPEYVEVMEHLTDNGRRIRPKPAGSVDNETYKLGEETIVDFIDGSQRYQFTRLRDALKNAYLLQQLEMYINTAAIRDNGIAGTA